MLRTHYVNAIFDVPAQFSARGTSHHSKDLRPDQVVRADLESVAPRPQVWFGRSHGVYLNGFVGVASRNKNRYVKETLQAPQYLRYVDDFALFSDDREFLVHCREQIEAYLATLRLRIHPIKSQLTQTQYGASFVGFRVLRVGEAFPKDIRIRVRNYNLQPGRRRLKWLKAEYARGQKSAHAVSQSLQSWNAHLAHGDIWRLRQQIFADLELPHPLQ